MIRSIENLSIKNAFLLNLTKQSDSRGSYVETWNMAEFEHFALLKPEVGDQFPSLSFVQDDYSRSHQGVLRGLHGDGVTWKLIQCLYGSMNFVMLDVDTKKALEFVLTDSNPQQILIPPQCVNGHLCISPECIFYYKQTTFYEDTQKMQFQVKWNDPIIIDQVKWNNVTNPKLSERDSTGPFLNLKGDL